MDFNFNPFLILFLFFGAAWIYRSWRALATLNRAPVVPLATAEHIPTQKVSVLIPAKNEEKNIAACVNSLIRQLGDGDEIIVINNCSEDKTEAILKELGAELITLGQLPKNPNAKLKYINTPPTPEGWTGKNFALSLGVRHASGHWFLFTDADTRHMQGSLYSSVAYAEKKELDLLTLLPKCLAEGFWENTIQPSAMGYLGLWFPIEEINDPKSSIYFGNGQYLLTHRFHYLGIGGHAAVKEAFLEDFALMKKTKESGGKGVCGFGMDLYGTRMYDSFDAICRGWRRIFLHAFNRNPKILFRRFLNVLTFSVMPFLFYGLVTFLAFTNPQVFGATWAVATPILGIIFITAWKVHDMVQAPKTFAIFHPIAAFCIAMILFDAWIMALLKKPTQWR